MALSGSDTFSQPAVSHRLVVLGLILAFVLPLFFAYVVFYDHKFLPQDTTNNGHLILPPMPVDSLAFFTPQGQLTDLKPFHGRWLLAYVAPRFCNKTCQSQVHFMRQINIALGKDRDRLSRLFITRDAYPEGAEVYALGDNYPGMHILLAKESQLSPFKMALRQNLAVPLRQDHLFIVDPLGNLMMSYAGDAAPKSVLKDLKKLLRISQIG